MANIYKMYPRKIGLLVEAALKDTPIVLIQGARQVGKSTLVKSYLKPEGPGVYITFDDLNALESAKRDPFNRALA